MIYTQLQIREIFHLEFLRWFSRKAKSGQYAIKGGVNLRLFFKSNRYSEDMDLDALDIKKDILLDSVMEVLDSASFLNTLKPFGIDGIVPPNISKAKQTDTTQRFKIHLITQAGEDLFTKIEFSRRGSKGTIKAESVSSEVTRTYKVAPIIAPHYDIYSTVEQKVGALISRSVTQARDIFDLYILSAQYKKDKERSLSISEAKIKQANNKIFEVSFEQFRDSLVTYLSDDDRESYGKKEIWDEIRLKAVKFLDELGGKDD